MVTWRRDTSMTRYLKAFPRSLDRVHEQKKSGQE